MEFYFLLDTTFNQNFSKKEAKFWLNLTTVHTQKSILIGEIHTFELMVPLTLN